LIIVDVSASTGAFVGTVCLIAVRRSVSGRTGCRRYGRVGKTLPYLRHSFLPKTERQTVIRQTVPTKAPVETEMSTIMK